MQNKTNMRSTLINNINILYKQYNRLKSILNGLEICESLNQQSSKLETYR